MARRRTAQILTAPAWAAGLRQAPRAIGTVELPTCIESAVVVPVVVAVVLVVIVRMVVFVVVLTVIVIVVPLVVAVTAVEMVDFMGVVAGLFRVLFCKKNRLLFLTIMRPY
jgi:hypothetical protein